MLRLFLGSVDKMTAVGFEKNQRQVSLGDTHQATPVSLECCNTARSNQGEISSPLHGKGLKNKTISCSGIWRGYVFLGAALKSASMLKGQLRIISICHPNHRSILGGRATASSSHVRLSLEPSNIIFSDIKLSCTEYLIYRFSVWRKAAHLHGYYSANFSLCNSLCFCISTGTTREDSVHSHERCLGNLCDCLAVLQRQARLVRSKAEPCLAPNRAQCRNSPSRAECSADTSVNGKGWPSSVYYWHGAISCAVITLLLSFITRTSHKLGFHLAFGYFQWQIMIS